MPVTPELRVAVSLVFVVLAGAPRAQAEESGDKQACLDAYEQVQRTRKAGQLLRARKHAGTCGQASCPTLVSSDCVGWARELDGAIPSVVFDVRTAPGKEASSCKVSIDGQLVPGALDGRSTPLDPGKHAFRIECPGSKPMALERTVVEGEKSQRISADFTAAASPRSAQPGAPPAAKSGASTGAWVMSAVSLAALGTFAALAVVGTAERNDLEKCKPSCDQDKVDAARTKLVIADVALGVGVISAGIATYLFLSAPSEPSRSALSIRLGASVSHTGPSISAAARF